MDTEKGAKHERNEADKVRETRRQGERKKSLKEDKRQRDREKGEGDSHKAQPPTPTPQTHRAKRSTRSSTHTLEQWHSHPVARMQENCPASGFEHTGLRSFMSNTEPQVWFLSPETG